MNRCAVLRAAGLAGAEPLGGAARAEMVGMPFGTGTRPLVTCPEKLALIRMTFRPPQSETPFAVLDEGLLTAYTANKGADPCLKNPASVRAMPICRTCVRSS